MQKVMQESNSFYFKMTKDGRIYGSKRDCRVHT